jgi:hypothetical protein
MSEPLVHVHVKEPGCGCLEIGKDGTTEHSGEVVGQAHVVVRPSLEVTAEFCENHRENYAHWDDFVRPEREQSKA